jgi:hypothetical protein
MANNVQCCTNTPRLPRHEAMLSLHVERQTSDAQQIM